MKNRPKLPPKWGLLLRKNWKHNSEVRTVRGSPDGGGRSIRIWEVLGRDVDSFLVAQHVPYTVARNDEEQIVSLDRAGLHL